MEEDYENILELSGTFNEQVVQVWESLKMSPQDVKDVTLLCGDIRQLLNQLWPGCQVNIFGSLITGLTFTTSDVDFLVMLPADCKESPVECLRKVIVRLSYITITKGSQAFETVCYVPKTRVPIITLRHVETRRKCDITFSHTVALDMTKLIKYLLNVDSRAFYLAVIIKYWSQVNKLTNAKRLTKFALSLLVIFFLQQKKILPSVATLQKNALVIIKDGWNIAFESVSHKCHNHESLYKLLGDFFVYYKKFNFEQFVICPYLGYAVKKTSFLNMHLPSEFDLYKRRVKNGTKSFKLNNYWCVQDPFEHNINCTLNLQNQLDTWHIDLCIDNAIVYYSYPSSKYLSLLFTSRETLPLNYGYILTDTQVSQEGRSWKFYCFPLFLFVFCIFLVKLSLV